MNEQNQHLETLQDIRKMMERSSRFISLSGLSGIAAGVIALIGAYFAYDWITEYNNNADAYTGKDFERLRWNLLGLALIVLGAAIAFAFYFTWRRAQKNNQPIWGHTSKNLIINMLIPLVTGGIFILAMLEYNEWRFVAPACLIFYGLALINASKYTLSEIRYLGICELILGIMNLWMIGYGLYFWAAGFGVLHIIYGIIMWNKYERKQ